jgi:hypothetical protein
MSVEPVGSNASGTTVETQPDESLKAWRDATVAAAEQASLNWKDDPVDNDNKNASTDQPVDGFDDPPKPAANAVANATQGPPPGSQPTKLGGPGSPPSSELVPVKDPNDARGMLEAGGYRVYQDAQGNYFVHQQSAVQVAVNEPSQNPPAPPPGQPVPTDWLPPATGATTTSPTPANQTGGAPPPEEPAPTPANGSDIITDVDFKLKTDLGEAADAILNKSQTLQEHWAELRAQGWKTEWKSDNGRNTTDRAHKVINLDPALKNDPAKLVEVFAHEVGHARFDLREVSSTSGLSREEYIGTNVNRHLDDEGAGMLEALKVKHELRNNDGPSVPLSQSGDTPFNVIYGDYVTGRITEQDALHRMGQQMADHEAAARRPDGTAMSYRQYYEYQYRIEWQRTHPGE